MCSKFPCKASKLINEKVLDATIYDQSGGNSYEVVTEVQYADHSVEAIAESFVVVLGCKVST